MEKYSQEFKEHVKKIIVGSFDDISKQTGLNTTELIPLVQQTLTTNKTVDKPTSKAKGKELVQGTSNVRIVVTDSKGNKQYLSKTYKLQLTDKETEAKVFKYGKTINKYVDNLARIHPTKTVVAVAI